MNVNDRLRWFVIVLTTMIWMILMALFSFWQDMTSDQKLYLFLLSALSAGSLAALGFAVVRMFRHYIVPLKKLAEETLLITSANASHRIRPQGGPPVARLAQIINEKADQFEELQNQVEQRIRLSSQETEQEKNILAAVVSELPEGILICNSEGRILLYNRQARAYLESEGHAAASGNRAGGGATRAAAPFLGLGRSVFGLMDKNVIAHALDEIAEKLQRKESGATARFIVPGSEDRLLHAEVLPLLNHRGLLTGFILILRDIIGQAETDNGTGYQMQQLTKGVGASLAKIRAGIEVLLEHRDMEPVRTEELKRIIHREAGASHAVLAETAADYARRMKKERPLVQMLGRDLLEILKRESRRRLGITLKAIDSTERNWIRTDCYALMLSVLFLLEHLQREMKTEQFTCKLEREGKYANLDLFWFGKPLKIRTLRDWETQMVRIGQQGLPFTLGEVILHHGARMWPATLRQTAGAGPAAETGTQPESAAKSGLRLFLPDVEMPEPDTLRKITLIPESRPLFYDFDLFNQAGQTPEMDRRLLSELTCTVFDTETTGLYPKVGDEIISIGAIRIVNGRLLREEFFDQLVDPQRPYWQSSVRVHGIEPKMLEGQPVIDRVLPQFHRFAEDSVLVAHNAAFDMNMLRMKEKAAGVTFDHPVLDTLLLSAVVQPAQDNHTLEAIAGRFGVSIVGRHTALGDALATGEIFLKLIPLLAQMGIRTLGEARTASQKTFFARFKY